MNSFDSLIFQSSLCQQLKMSELWLDTANLISLFSSAMKTICNFALGMPTCWYLKTLKFALSPNLNAKICITPNVNPQRKQVEYRWRWVPNARGWRWACGFHVIYFLFPRVGYPMQTQFPVEYGLWAFNIVSMIELHFQLHFQQCI